MAEFSSEKEIWIDFNIVYFMMSKVMQLCVLCDQGYICVTCYDLSSFYGFNPRSRCARDE
jgi:hypothetical protein